MPAPRVSQPSNAPDSAPNPNRLKLVDYKKVFRAVVFTALAFLAACAPLIRQPVVDPTPTVTPTSIPNDDWKWKYPHILPEGPIRLASAASNSAGSSNS